MEKIATSFCSFERLVKKYTYVDKTDELKASLHSVVDGIAATFGIEVAPGMIVDMMVKD